MPGTRGGIPFKYAVFEPQDCGTATPSYFHPNTMKTLTRKHLEQANLASEVGTPNHCGQIIARYTPNPQRGGAEEVLRHSARGDVFASRTLPLMNNASSLHRQETVIPRKVVGNFSVVGHIHHHQVSLRAGLE